VDQDALHAGSSEGEEETWAGPVQATAATLLGDGQGIPLH